MGLGKFFGKITETASDLTLGVIHSRLVQGVLKGTFKGISKSVDPAAGVAEKAWQAGEKVVGAATNKETYKKIGKAVESGAGKVVKNTLTDPDSYKQIGKTNILVSNKSLLLDDMQRRINTGLNTTAAILKGHQISNTKLGRAGNKLADKLEDNMVNKALLGLPGGIVRKASNLNTGLVTSGGDNLMPFGMKATGLGVVAAATFQVGAGTPEAVKSWNQNRQGTNYDRQPVTSAPKVPAYAQNGGATGDLVFALNNLRHGGMM